ncbi:salicylate synthase [Actinomadura algeriensis]|uniref:Salicylate synthetase n=1 Tax=Actinomadura algeriensis TaxID=1679523 RepID=A0ABR9K014_9ACTN|nr:salicylate synthase [Actinomadura algeriensis]MBE1535921.1 salicylate synthetase [Actinomadura algeriensis]
MESAADPLALMAGLAGSGLFGDHVVYERPGSWTFAGGTLGEVVLEDGELRTRWPGAEPTSRPWTGRPADALREAFAAAPLPVWNAYGWIAFEFAAERCNGTAAERRDGTGAERHNGTAAERRDDAAAASGGRLAHLVVPRVEVRVQDGRAHITGVDGDEIERVAKLLAAGGAAPPAAASPVDVRTGGDAYREKVARAVADIGAGRYQKVIVSRRLDISHPVDTVATYARGRAANTPARSFLFDLDGFQAAGFSPEVLASVDADGTVMTQPLAGTRAFGRGADADARTRRELESDPKEIFEHAVSVRTSQDELYRVCAPGTVRVTGFMTVKERGSVQHLGSSVSGALAPGRTCWDALDALFPGVTASGIPKPEAIEAIGGLEERRGLYSGAVLAVSHDGSLDSALVLRALYNRDGRAWLRAGAGIVSGSTPEREYEETCEKLSSIAPYVVPLAR